MNVFCTEEFKKEYNTLIKKNSYKTLTESLINHFYDKEISELCTGVNLNLSDTTPYIKKKIEGSGGFRLYYYIVIKNDNVYLMFVHPKTGSLGYENITKEKRTLLLKDILVSITQNELYTVTFNIEEKEVLFSKN